MAFQFQDEQQAIDEDQSFFPQRTGALVQVVFGSVGGVVEHRLQEAFDCAARLHAQILCDPALAEPSCLEYIRQRHNAFR